jgi:hypothetical protein
VLYAVFFRLQRAGPVEERLVIPGETAPAEAS